MENKIQGIYRIRNLVNGKIYIGGSIDVKQRWRHHTNGLNGHYHRNDYLNRSWDKYGCDNFVFEIVEEVKNTKDLSIREQWFLDNVIRWGIDYNLSKHTDAPMRGRKGKEHPKWGKKVSDDAKKKISDGHKGKKFSEETRKKMSDAQKGEKNNLYGKHHSEKTKKKMSESQSGKKGHWWGKKFSDEVRKNMSKGKKGLYVGELASGSKLKTADVLEIKALLKTGNLTQREIGEIFGIDPSTVSNIKTGKRWGHLLPKDF